MNRLLSILIVITIIAPAGMATDLTDYEDRGYVEDSLSIDIPDGSVGYHQARLIQLPIEDHTWETVTLETDTLMAPDSFWDVAIEPIGEVFFTDSASLDVSGLDPGQYAAFIYTCETSRFPECSWMKPQVFSLTVPPEDLSTSITGPDQDGWYNDDLGISIDETNVPSLSCSYSLDSNGDGSPEQSDERTCNEVPIISVGSDGTCSTIGANTCQIDVEIANSEGDTETDSASFNIDYTDPNVDLDLDPAGSNVQASIDVSSDASPIRECRIDWNNDPPYDISRSFDSQSLGFDETHTYSTGGEKTVLVTCRDAAGNVNSTTASVTVTGDFSTSIESPDADSWHSDTFSATVSDSYDVSDVTCEYRLDFDGSSWDTDWQSRECGNELEIEAGPGTDCDTQGQNKCRLQTRMSDDDGHVATDIRAFNIDYEEPPVDLVLDGSDTAVEAEVSAGPTHSKIETCRIDWHDDPPYDESWDVNSQVTTDTRTHDYEEAGTYTVAANCTDQAGNSMKNTESISVPLDADLSTTIEGPEAASWHRTSFSIDVSDDGTAAGLTCEYRIDNGNSGSWNTDWLSRSCDDDQQITVGTSGQCSEEGTDTCRVQVRSRDANGNEDRDTRSFSIDYTQPDVSVAPDPTSEMAIEAGIQAESVHSPITECKLDWLNDPPFDVTRTFDSASVSTTESHTYTAEGTHTILLRCQDEAGNSRDATGDVHLPYEEPLDYTLIDDPVDGTITDQDAFMAEIEAATNAETILWEMNDETYELTHDGGDTYNTLIDISDLTGTYDVSLIFRKDGEELTEAPYKTITFADTPPKPGLSIATLDGNAGIEASVTTNYDTATDVTLDIAIDDTDGNERYSDTKTITCDGSCSTTFDESVSDGETVTVSGTQTAYDLESNEQTRTLTVAAAPEIHDIDFEGPVGTEVASTGYWRADFIGIMASGFAYEDINSVRLVDETDQIIGTTVTNDGIHDFSDFLLDTLDLDDSEGNAIVGFNASFDPDEISSEETLDFEVELEDGTTVTHEFATIEKIASPPPPSIDEIAFSGVLADEVNITLELSDPYHEEVSYEIRDVNGDIVAEEDNIQIEDGDGSTKVTINSLPSSDGMAEIEAWAQNPAGESSTETAEALVDPDALLEPFEINGDPQEKINMILYGHRYSMTELENTVAPEAIDFFFESGDLADVHGPYQDHFNWYLIDTDEELCPYDVDENDCDFLENNIATFESGDTIKGGNAGIAVLSDQYFRSWAWPPESFSLTSFSDGSTFAHELGHQVWGYDDEYNGGNSQYWGWTINLFPAHDSYDKDRYPNTWPDQESCQEAIEENYTSLSPSDCDEIIGSEPIWRIRAGDGPSLMEASSDPAVYYKTHEKRVEYLMENNPYYNGE